MSTYIGFFVKSGKLIERNDKLFGGMGNEKANGIRMGDWWTCFGGMSIKCKEELFQ